MNFWERGVERGLGLIEERETGADAMLAGVAPAFRTISPH
jgi:hypothetical protein